MNADRASAHPCAGLLRALPVFIRVLKALTRASDGTLTGLLLLVQFQEIVAEPRTLLLGDPRGRLL